jgi:polygalacturonase
MEIRSIVVKKALFLAFLFLTVDSFSQSLNILDFGAKANGATINTVPIQAAIDKCSLNGGGQVIVPAGTFLSGTLILKASVELHLMEGAVLKGSADFKDYPYLDVKFQSQFTDKSYYTKKKIIQRYRAFIFAEAVKGVSITGYGTIDGNGSSPAFQLGGDAGSRESMERPILILMIDSKDIYVANIHLRNSAYWMQNYLACENVHIKGINVYNHSNYNNDGIDIDSKNVLIEDSYIDVDDDGICMKSHDPERFCENVVIRNCTVRTNCNAIKFGTGSLGGFRNIQVTNVTIKQASEDGIRNWQENLEFIEQPKTILAGIALENVDGGITDNITFRNIFMNDVQTPFFIKLGNRDLVNDDGESITPDPGRLRNVKLENITAVSHSKMTSSITGIPNYDVENIELSNINISSMGKGTLEESLIDLPENEKDYPENRMFGYVLPSSGLYLRHAKGIVLRNVNLEVRNKDFRPAVIMDDVKGADIGLMDIDPPAGNTPAIKLVNCQNICRSEKGNF